MLKDRLVFGISDSIVQQRLLAEKNLTFAILTWQSQLNLRRKIKELSEVSVRKAQMSRPRYARNVLRKGKRKRRQTRSLNNGVSGARATMPLIAASLKAQYALTVPAKVP
ncbi:hypothetical protein MRX96_006002 [Rhipicephalus microplus]